jgi:hypothetical protein
MAGGEGECEEVTLVFASFFARRPCHLCTLVRRTCKKKARDRGVQRRCAKAACEGGVRKRRVADASEFLADDSEFDADASEFVADASEFVAEAS